MTFCSLENDNKTKFLVLKFFYSSECSQRYECSCAQLYHKYARTNYSNTYSSGRGFRKIEFISYLLQCVCHKGQNSLRYSQKIIREWRYSSCKQRGYSSMPLDKRKVLQGQHKCSTVHDTVELKTIVKLPDRNINNRSSLIKILGFEHFTLIEL